LNLAPHLEDSPGTREDNRAMNVPFAAKVAQSWPLALGLSLLLHGSLVLPFFFLSSRDRWGEHSRSLLIDTRAQAPLAEVNVVLCGSRHAEAPSTQPVEPPQVVASVATPLVSRDEKREPTSPTSRVRAEHEAAEEQEPSTGSPTPGSHRHPESAGPGAGHGATTFFQIAARGEAIVFVIDRSGSMGLNGGFAMAKRELLGSLERLPFTTRFQVIAYNRLAEPLRVNGQSGLVFATPENKQCVALALAGMHAEGSTEHLAALKRALALGPDVIFFLTDGDGLRHEQIRAITSLNRGRAVIHAIKLGRMSAVHGELPMCALALENQGSHKAVPLGP
jgi:hypothetical protein